LLAADHIVVPLAADLLSLQGLQNLGPSLRAWRSHWQERALTATRADIDLPQGTMNPLGYVVLQHAVRLDRPTMAYDLWFRRIGPEFAKSLLGEASPSPRYQLASLRNYRSLMSLSQDARKPMFELRAADGALGSTGRLVQICFDEFKALAERLVTAVGIPAPAAIA
jgi:hypothetical protein